MLRTNGDSPLFRQSRYWLIVVLFALGLLCKPMLVTVPFVLLLLDFWPLGRWGENAAPSKGTVPFSPARKSGQSPITTLIVEKLPLFALSAASCATTYFVQRAAGAVTESISPMIRVQTVVLGYGRYLAMLFWPFGLAAPYPRDRHVYLTATLLCGLAVAAISAGVLIWCRTRWRYMLTGWFWFLGMLVPVIGLIVVGYQSAADRYTYLSYTGLFVALVWGAAEALGLGAGSGEQGAGSMATRWGWAIAGLLLVFCMVRSFQQAGVWRDNEALYTQALAVTEDNFMAHSNLGKELEKQGKLPEAEREYRESLDIEPADFQAHNSLGVIERRRGNLAAAIEHYAAALKEKPDFALAHNNLGCVYADQGKMAEAQQEWTTAIQYDADLADAEDNMGHALNEQKQCAEAIPHCRRAIELEPARVQSHLDLGIALFATRSFDEGIEECKRAIEIDPDDVAAHNELAKMYHTLGRFGEAGGEWQEVLKRQPGNAVAAKGLGMLLVKSGHGADAIPYLQAALTVVPQDIELRRFKVFARSFGQGPLQCDGRISRGPSTGSERQVHSRRLVQGVKSKPADVERRVYMAYALVTARQMPAAAAEFREVLRLDPKNLDGLNSLAWIEAAHPDAKLRNGKEAVQLAEKAAELRKDDVSTLDTLAAAYAEAGRFREAVETARKAQQAAEKMKNPALIERSAARLKLYTAEKPYRDQSMAN